MPTGYSLHIGLNYVNAEAYDGWNGQLAGCVNDANSMEALAADLEFVGTKLLNEEATSQAVVAELSGLAQRAEDGDLVLVTYSGHGGQVDDVNGDEDEGLDETWVLYDRQLVDDELYQMWSQFESGVRLVVLSDSCHSGTVAKMVAAKTSREALVDARTKDIDERESGAAALTVGEPRALPIGVQLADGARRKGTYCFVQNLAGPKTSADIEAGVILISGCQDNQLSYDGAVNGQFTGTLLEVWDEGSFRGDYRQLHREILDRMPPDQSPNLFTVGQVASTFLGQQPFSINPSVSGSATGSTSGSTSGGSSRPMLAEGDDGSDVRYLQERLVAHGYDVDVDGDFGSATTEAVRSFQQAQGLSRDGIVGSATWAALEAEPVAGTGSSGGSDPLVTGNGSGPIAVAARPIVRRGDTGEHVLYLQERLVDWGYTSVSTDGVFGPGTQSAVRSFQSSQGLVADGIVGEATWEALG